MLPDLSRRGGEATCYALSEVASIACDGCLEFAVGGVGGRGEEGWGKGVLVVGCGGKGAIMKGRRRMLAGG